MVAAGAQPGFFIEGVTLCQSEGFHQLGHCPDFSKRGVTLCQSEGFHQIVMPFPPPIVGW